MTSLSKDIAPQVLTSQDRTYLGPLHLLDHVTTLMLMKFATCWDLGICLWASLNNDYSTAELIRVCLNALKSFYFEQYQVLNKRLYIIKLY